MNVGPLLCTMWATWRHDITIKVLPPFIPNDYLFETHRDKGEEKWQIYAWAVRDAMSVEGELPLTE